MFAGQCTVAAGPGQPVAPRSVRISAVIATLNEAAGLPTLSKDAQLLAHALDLTPRVGSAVAPAN